MAKTPDVLDSPAIRRRTERVLALKEKIIQAESGLAFIIADLGDELIVTEAAFAKTHAQGAWARWLASNVKFTVETAEHYMNVARLRKNFKIDFEVFSRLGPTDLYLIADLPDRLVKRLAKDPRLPDPKTGRLSSATKGLGEDAAERLRVGILKWPAWLTPQKGRRLRRR